MQSRSHVVVTTLGTDRPGIVEDISGWLLEHGGNIEDSRMSLLGGEFATLILVSGPADLPEKLEHTRPAFEERHHLTVFTRPVSAAQGERSADRLRYIIRATSLDHPGIVHQVSQLLRQQSVNIVSAETRTAPAPFSGAPVFQFEMEVDVPTSVRINDLRDGLETLGRRDNIDISLNAREA